MAGKKRIDPALLAQWEAERAEFRKVFDRWMARLKAAEERDAQRERRRRARLGRLTFGVFGREPAQSP